MSSYTSTKKYLIRIIFLVVVFSIFYMISTEEKISASAVLSEEKSKIVKYIATKYTKSDSIVLREYPNLKSKKVATLKKGSVLKVTNKKTMNGSVWVLGESNEKNGWVELRYLSNQKEDKSLSKAVEYGSKYIGIPYKFGGIKKDGFDCSGFTQYIYKSLKKDIPRTASKQYESSSKISKNKANPGDLVFFSNDGKKVTHVAIYAGGDKILHASTSKGVKIGKINDGYWNKRLIGFGTFS